MSEVNSISASLTASAAASVRHEKDKLSASSTKPVTQPARDIDVDFDPIEFNKAVEQIDNFLKSNAKPRMSISVDETLNRPVVRLQDPNGGHVRTIPSEEVIRISKNIELMKGVFFDAKS